MTNGALTGRKKQPVWMYVIGGIASAYSAYLLNACYRPGKDINYVMEHLNVVLGNPFSDYWNSTTVKAIVGGLFVYLIVLLMYITSRHKYMPGQEFGTAVFADPKIVSKKFKDKDESNNRILSQNVRMSMNTRKTRLNLNYLVIGGSGAGKTLFMVKPNLLTMTSSFIVTDPKGGARRSSLKRTGTSQLNHCLL